MTTSKLDYILPPNQIPVRLGIPYHGLVKVAKNQPPRSEGVLILPNEKIKPYLKTPDGPNTILWQPTLKTYVSDTRSEKAKQQDSIEGRQWLNYAYISGNDYQIMGANFNPVQTNLAPTPSRLPVTSSFRWPYHDGYRTWILEAKITPTLRYSGTDPSYKIKILVKGLFGGFGYPEFKSSDIYVVKDEFLFNSNMRSGYEPYFIEGYQYPTFNFSFSKDGSYLGIGLGSYWPRGCDIYFDDFLSIHPWVRLTLDVINGYGRWLSDLYSGSAWSRFKISGEGSVKKGEMGKGITASFVDSDYFWYYSPLGPPEDYYGNKNQQIMVLSPEGTPLIWGLDEYTDKLFCDEWFSRGAVPWDECAMRNGLNHMGSSIYGSYVLNPSYGCYDDYALYTPYVGVKIEDNMLKTYMGSEDNWHKVHLTGKSSKLKGITYDIKKDVWYEENIFNRDYRYCYV
jgi:hypothetical protein